MTLAMNHLAIDEETKQRISINFPANNIATMLDETKTSEEPVYIPTITKYKYKPDKNINDKECSYVWNLDSDNESKTNDIFNIKNGSYTKPIYLTIDTLHFACYFYPNGHNKESQGQIDWVIQLLSLPAVTSNMTVEFKIVLMNTMDGYSSNITFNNNNMTIYFNDFIPRNDIINDNIKDLNFKIFMKIIEKRDEENKLQYNDTTENISLLDLSYLPSTTLIWSTKNDSIMNTMKKYDIGNFKTTNIFDVKSFKFFMKIYPNGKNISDAGIFCLELILITKPPKISSFSMICLLNNNFNILNENNMSVCFDNICNFETFQNMNEFKLNLEIIFIDIYNISNNSIMNAYNNTNDTNDCKTLTLGSNSYKWLPNNTEEMLNAMNTKYFESEIFELESFKFMLQIYPNGYTPSHNGQLSAFLYLAALSPKILKVIALIRLRIFINDDLSYSFIDTGEYNIHNSKLGWITTGITDIEYLSGIKQLKFEVNVLIIDVFDIDGNTLKVKDYQTLKSPLQNTLKTNICCRTWNIHNKKAIELLINSENGESFESGFFRLNKLEFNIKLYPNGNNKVGFDDGDILLQIQLKELVKPIESLSFMYKFYIKETNTWFSDIAYYKHTNDDYNNLRSNWTLSHLNINKLKSLEKLTIKLELKLLEVYAKSNILMTHIY
eukprot:345455_1